MFNTYGVQEDNPLEFASVTHDDVDFAAGTFDLSDRSLVTLDRIRLLTDPGYPYLDLSYCYGTLKDGRKVRVDLGETRFGRRTYKGELLRLAKAAGRYGVGMGMFDTNTISILWG